MLSFRTWHCLFFIKLLEFSQCFYGGTYHAGINLYSLWGDYFIPDIRLNVENRQISRWRRMCRDYIKEHRPALYSQLYLSGELWIYLADLNEQAQNSLELIIEQMKGIEGVTEDLKQHDQIAWVGIMNSIRNQAEEIIITEMINRQNSATK